MNYIEIVGSVVASMTALKLIGMFVERTWGSTRKPELITRSECDANHKLIKQELGYIKADVKEVKTEMRELARKVQNGDVANRVANAVVQHLKERQK